ncbi:MAG: rsmE [Frankiales bacterium]|nr:rsmE [Frankiales bacterium]
MTPPLFLVPDLGSAGPGDALVLTGDEARHLAVVKRIGVGEAVLLSDGRGGLADAVVESVARDEVRLRITDRSTAAEPVLRFVVVQALPKGDRGELAVEVMTELGVDELVPWSAARSISQWRGEKAERGVAKWRRTASEASKQSRRSRIPLVAGLASTELVADRLRAADLALVLHEDAEHSLDLAALPVAGDVVVVVGPEGGIDPAELARFEQAGARLVRLGAEVMRSSTAGGAALAVLSVAAGRWR